MSAPVLNLKVNPVKYIDALLAIASATPQHSLEGAASEAPALEILSLADLASLVESWTDWPAETRRTTLTYLRTCAFAATTAERRRSGRTDGMRRADVRLSDIPCDVPRLNELLFAYPAPIYGMQEDAFRNAISALRRVLRRIELLEPAKTPDLVQDGAWSQLLSALQVDEHCQIGLGRFASWCERRGVAAAQVSGAVLADYEAFVRNRTLHADIPGLMRAIRKSWGKAARLVVDWPQVVLRQEQRRKPYTLPFSAFPTSLQKDVAAFEARLSGSDRRGPFRSCGPRQRLRPSSIKARLFSLRQGASALVLLGRDPTTIERLADLIEPEAFEAILMFFWERNIAAARRRGELPGDVEPDAEIGVSQQTGAIATALMIVAKYHCSLGADALKVLREMAANVTPHRQGAITRKNLERLRQFDDPAVRLKLLTLSARLMRQADAHSDPLRGARLARLAVAVEILLHVPLRIGNLAALRIGPHLKSHDARGARFTHLALEPHETKNRNQCSWGIEPELADMLGHYVKRHRPMLTPAGGDWLFPSGPTKSTALTAERLGEAIKDIIAAEVGAVMNPHLFRAFAARVALEQSPGALEDVRILLGDKSLVTVLAHYATVEPSQAARRHDERLRNLRRGIGRISSKHGGKRR